MPRKKITLEEAFAVFEQHGLQVKVQAVTEPDIVVPSEEPIKKVHTPTKLGNNTVKIALYAKHSVGSGGMMTGLKGEQQIEHAGVETYGPGIAYVPVALANHLLHQDALARQSDERMLDRQQRCYVVAPRVGPSGQRSNVAVQVTEDMVNNLGNLPADMMYNIR